MTNTINELIKVIDNSINQQEFEKLKLVKTEKGYYSFDSNNKILVNDSKYEIFWYAYRLYFKSFMYEIGYGDKELLVESKIFIQKYKNMPISPVFYIESINKKAGQPRPGRAGPGAGGPTRINTATVKCRIMSAAPSRAGMEAT